LLLVWYVADAVFPRAIFFGTVCCVFVGDRAKVKGCHSVPSNSGINSPILNYSDDPAEKLFPALMVVAVREAGLAGAEFTAALAA
jgi:hypothetical protein